MEQHSLFKKIMGCISTAIDITLILFVFFGRIGIVVSESMEPKLEKGAIIISLLIWPYKLYAFIKGDPQWVIKYLTKNSAIVNYTNTKDSRFPSTIYHQVAGRYNANTLIVLDRTRFLQYTSKGKYGKALWEFYDLELVPIENITHIHWFKIGKTTGILFRCLKFIILYKSYFLAIITLWNIISIIIANKEYIQLFYESISKHSS